MKHTKEPWKKASLYRCYILSDTNENVAITTYHEDARRIVACVNACAGITNEALEAGVVHSALINFEESLDLEKGEQFCFYDIPVLEDV